MNPSDHDKPTMGENPGEQGDFASGKDDEGQHAEQAVEHDDANDEGDAHANEPRTDEAAPPAQGPAA